MQLHTVSDERGAASAAFGGAPSSQHEHRSRRPAQARRCGETICALVEIAGTRSNFPCFVQTPVTKVLAKLRKRLLMHKAENDVDAEVRVCTGACSQA